LGKSTNNYTIGGNPSLDLFLNKTLDRDSSSLNSFCVLTSTQVKAFEIKPVNPKSLLACYHRQKLIDGTYHAGILNPEFKVTGIVGLIK
jgi:hypothetical protein